MTVNPQSRFASIETPFTRQDQPLTFVESDLLMMKMRIAARAAGPRAKPGLPPMFAAMSGLIARLRERKLVQWALAYGAAAFALIQVLDIVAQRFGWPEQTIRVCVIALAVSKSVLKFWAQADLQVAAILGDRAEANRRAAAIDAQPAGPFVLGVITAYCLCGAPFHLDATPNFKARLAESGLPWPPQPVLPFAKPAAATASGAAQ